MSFRQIVEVGVAALIFIGCVPCQAEYKEPTIVILGSNEGAIDFYKKADFWGEVNHKRDLLVPKAIVVAIHENWKKETDQLPVDLKKEFFYRALVPMILLENELILTDRKRLKSLADQYGKGEALPEKDIVWLKKLAVEYRLLDNNETKNPISQKKIGSLIDELLLRVDMVPPALALGQAAYESGYGTSRFTLKGNALFGQWTYGGKGMKPKEHRKSKGSYSVAAFDWPLDSLRSYVNNLNTNRSYEDFRKKRAELRERGEPLTGLVLADTLIRYSERGQAYVDTLKGIIRNHGLDVADKARLRDEPLVLIVNVNTEADIEPMRKEIDRLRATGELEEIITGMGLGEHSRFDEQGRETSR